MNKAQREALQIRHKSNLNALDVPKEPCLKRHIREGLNSGLKFKVVSATVIKAKATERSWDKWNDHLDLHELFEPRPEFKKKLANFKREKAKYDRALARYKKEAKPLLDQADLDPKANAYELNILLTKAAKDAGLVK